MNEEVKKKWIEALESGEYRQATGTLKGELEQGGVGYCCLGVLVELYRKEHQDIECRLKETGSGDYEYYWDDGEEDNYLPPQVQKWAQLPYNPGIFEGSEFTLAALNDGGNSLEEIAKIIKERL